MHRYLWVITAAALLLRPYCEGFQGAHVLQREATTGVFTASNVKTALRMAASRKARRMQNVEKQGKSRPEAFFDAVDDAEGKKAKKGSPPGKDDKVSGTDAVRDARAVDAGKRMDQRPDVSTMIVDKESGIEVVVQGKAVMDVVTRKEVALSNGGSEYRLAQMFPGVHPNIKDAYRFDWKTAEVPLMVKSLREACCVKLEDGRVGIPPHPSLTSKGIDFVLANRDYLGYKMKRTLGRLQMRSMWKGNVEEARDYQALWKNFLTVENHISAPFRQIIMNGEGRMGPQFGNLDLMSFCCGELYERLANYIVLKGMAAHWEKKVNDAAHVERIPPKTENFMTVLATGDPKRYLPDPPILFTLKECTQVCLMAQRMCKAFVETEELFNDFPPEIRFLEMALTIKGGSPLRKYMIEDFCPREGITPDVLREGMRRLYEQLANMQIEPYGDLTNIVNKLTAAMSVGTDDEHDPYQVYLGNTDPDGPGYFQTYTFNHDQLSLVRFLDAQYERSGNSEHRPTPVDITLTNFFKYGGQEHLSTKVREVSRGGQSTYRAPAARAAGRPHDLGWLELLGEESDKSMRLGEIPPGQIIS